MALTGRHCAVPKAVSAGKAMAMLLLAAFFWGSGNLANKSILLDLDPFAVVVLRHLIAVIALLPLALSERGRSPLRVWLPSVLPASVLFAAASIVQQWGYQGTTVTNASFLVNTAGVLTPVLSVMMFRERLRPFVALAALLTLLGALLMSGAATGFTGLNSGDALCLVSALFYAGWTVLLGRHILHHARPVAATLAQCAVAGLIAAPFALIASPALAANWTGALPEALYLGVFSTAAAVGLTSAAQRVISAPTTAIVISAESLFGAAGGIVLLGERPGILAGLGAALMLLAIALVTWPLRERSDKTQIISYEIIDLDQGRL